MRTVRQHCNQTIVCICTLRSLPIILPLKRVKSKGLIYVFIKLKVFLNKKPTWKTWKSFLKLIVYSSKQPLQNVGDRTRIQTLFKPWNCKYAWKMSATTSDFGYMLAFVRWCTNFVFNCLYSLLRGQLKFFFYFLPVNLLIILPKKTKQIFQIYFIIPAPMYR